MRLLQLLMERLGTGATLVENVYVDVHVCVHERLSSTVFSLVIFVLNVDPAPMMSSNFSAQSLLLIVV